MNHDDDVTESIDLDLDAAGRAIDHVARKRAEEVLVNFANGAIIEVKAAFDFDDPSGHLPEAYRQPASSHIPVTFDLKYTCPVCELVGFDCGRHDE